MADKKLGNEIVDVLGEVGVAYFDSQKAAPRTTVVQQQPEKKKDGLFANVDGTSLLLGAAGGLVLGKMMFGDRR